MALRLLLCADEVVCASSLRDRFQTFDLGYKKAWVMAWGTSNFNLLQRIIYKDFGLAIGWEAGIKGGTMRWEVGGRQTWCESYLTSRAHIVFGLRRFSPSSVYSIQFCYRISAYCVHLTRRTNRPVRTRRDLRVMGWSTTGGVSGITLRVRNRAPLVRGRT